MSGQRKGFCPSLWRPMSSGDGLLVRVRAGARALRSAELRAVAQLSREHGNGLIELTRRANLQLRGVREDALPALQRALVQLGLAEQDPALEHRLSLLVSPLAGLDPRCAEVGVLAAAVEQALRHAGPLPELPSKFGLVVDGGDPTLHRVFAHIRLRTALSRPGHVAVGIGGDAESTRWLGVYHAREAPEVVVWLAREYTHGGRAPATEQLQSPFFDTNSIAIRIAGLDEYPADFADLALGYHDGSVPWYGTGLPFGSADAAVWRALADAADEWGSGDVRVTPTRVVVIPGVSAAGRAALRELARHHGLITDAADPLQHVEACPGAPACSSALGETRSLARALVAACTPSTRRATHAVASGTEVSASAFAAQQAPQFPRLSGEPVSSTTAARADVSASTSLRQPAGSLTRASTPSAQQTPVPPGGNSCVPSSASPLQQTLPVPPDGDSCVPSSPSPIQQTLPVPPGGDPCVPSSPSPLQQTLHAPMAGSGQCPSPSAFAGGEGLAARADAASVGVFHARAKLHVSGCGKGCAFSGSAAVTLVLAADGCKLGLGLDAARTDGEPASPVQDVVARVVAWAREDQATEVAAASGSASSGEADVDTGASRRTVSLGSRQHVDRQHVDRQHVDRQHVDRQHVDRQHVDRQRVDRQHVDRQHVDRAAAGMACLAGSTFDAPAGPAGPAALSTVVADGGGDVQAVAGARGVGRTDAAPERVSQAQTRRSAPGSRSRR
ncbi:MAG: hypothetical protein ABW321_30830 [Polyangiales bacterium]